MQVVQTRIREIEFSLSPNSMNLWLEFGDFLRQKDFQHRDAQPHNLLELAGGLEHSKNFSGDPLEIQEKLRSEWD